MQKKSHHVAGFTLMELVISISIFMLFIALAGGAFISLVSANRKAVDEQKTYREIRFALDTFSYELKNGIVDFGCITPSALDVACIDNQTADHAKVLSVIQPDLMQRNVYRLDVASHRIQAMHQTRTAFDAPWATDREWQALTSGEVVVRDLTFSFFPSSDPYAAVNAAQDDVQWQPSVGINMATDKLTVKTTYSSRFYGSRRLYEQL